jgi:RNA polymerase-binding transcription factor
METVVWGPEAVERLRTSLVELKRRLLRSALDVGSEESRYDADDLPDEIDTAASEHSHFVRLTLHERDRSLLRRIETALRRIATGRFAICDRCGQEISPDRLKVLPVTTLCVDCQEEEELELRRMAASRPRTI